MEARLTQVLLAEESRLLARRLDRPRTWDRDTPFRLAIPVHLLGNAHLILGLVLLLIHVPPELFPPLQLVSNTYFLLTTHISSSYRSLLQKPARGKCLEVFWKGIVNLWVGILPVMRHYRNIMQQIASTKW